MGFLNILGSNKDKENQGPVEQMAMPFGSDPYGPMTQGIDPATMQMLNQPQQGGNVQIAQYAIDNDDIIEEVRMHLRGYRVVRTYNIEKKEYELKEERFGDRVMNEKGINDTCRVLSTFLAKPFALSNFGIDDKPRMDMAMLILWKKLASMYAINGHDYELDKSRRSPLAFQFTMLVHMNAQRSFEDGERPRMYGSHRTMQTIQQIGGSSQQAPQKKFLGIFG